MARVAEVYFDHIWSWRGKWWIHFVLNLRLNRLCEQRICGHISSIDTQRSEIRNCESKREWRPCRVSSFPTGILRYGLPIAREEEARTNIDR